MSMENTTIITNRIVTPDGTMIESLYRHDFKCHVDANGHTYCVDGGRDYLKRTWSQDAPQATEASVYSNDSHSKIREYLRWGTRGKDDKNELKYVFLKDMDSCHIQAILDSQPQISETYRNAFQSELKWRSQ